MPLFVHSSSVESHLSRQLSPVIAGAGLGTNARVHADSGMRNDRQSPSIMSVSWYFVACVDPTKIIPRIAVSLAAIVPGALDVMTNPVEPLARRTRTLFASA